MGSISLQYFQIRLQKKIFPNKKLIQTVIRNLNHQRQYAASQQADSLVEICSSKQNEIIIQRLGHGLASRSYSNQKTRRQQSANKTNQHNNQYFK